MSALPPPPTTRKARATHDTLVAATRQVIRRTGVLSADEVAETARMSPATFYAYFASKDTALAAAFDLVLSEMEARVEEAANIERLLEEGLEETVRALVTTVVDGFRLDARIFRLAVGRLGESEMVRAVYRDRQQRAMDLLVRFVRLGAAAAKVRSEPDAPTVARALLVTLQGLQNPLLHESEDDADLSALLTEMVESLLRPEPSG